MRQPRITILMGTKNGARWIEGQLGSISAQRGIDWSLCVSDDGSDDGTPEILQAFSQKHSERVLIQRGPRRGAAMNYLSMFEHVPADADFVALSDQDDVWKTDRLSRAARSMQELDPDRPCIYASRTWQVGTSGGSPRRSRRHRHAPCFENALLQNIMAGNTIVLNAPAVQIVKTAKVPEGGVPFHDWWIYALLAGAGATTILDDEATLFYRQHQSNSLGAHSGLSATARRLAGVARSEYGGWLRDNLRALDANRSILTRSAQSSLAAFSDALAAPLPIRGACILASGAFRQTMMGDLCVLGAATLGRI